jgi:colanic acid biosynthesis protein WcaH
MSPGGVVSNMNIMDHSRRLSNQEFLELIKNGPLVSIDLIIKNKKGEVLLGFRNNAPARGTWFVPGGRIYKNERLDAEFERIAQTELGVKLRRKDARFFTIAEHFYPGDNTFNEPGIDTHYVVLAYVIDQCTDDLKPADNQHTRFIWLPVEELLKKEDVHQNTRDYFLIFPSTP